MINEGLILETLCYEKLLNNFSHTDLILSERELIKLFGFFAASVDFLIINKIRAIAIQIKWTNTHRYENKNIINFITSCEYIKTFLGDREFVMIWSSKKDPFLDNKKFFKVLNVKCISNFNQKEDLIFDTISYCKRIYDF